MNRLLPLAVTLAALCAGNVQARKFDACGVESDYDLTIGNEVLTFSRSAGTPQRIEMRDGRLTIDGAAQTLSAADTARIASYERDIRGMVPEVKAIAVDAVGIATEAVVQVAAAFAGERGNAAAVAKLEQLGADIGRRIDASVSTSEWREDEFNEAIESMTAELVPMLVGDIAALAVSAALTGDEAGLAEIEAKATSLERDVEARVAKRADAIEARAEKLCPRVLALDEIEKALELRLADGSQLDLVRMEVE